ncbi:MAG: lipoyl(octanoyl) transferase LipB [Deltaproteobacteria bacterium]
MESLRWSWLGRVEYSVARELQESLARQLAEGLGPEMLLCLEHPAVFTMGRNRSVSEAVQETAARAGVPILRTDRGGDLTWHGPGQLVLYPVMRLRAAGLGVRTFVTALTGALQDAAAAVQVRSWCDPQQPGLFVGDRDGRRKLGSVGLAVRRGITLHGAALNLERTAEEGFLGLAPCGLAGVRPTSLAAEAPANVPAPASAQCAALVAQALAGRLNYAGLLRLSATELLGGAARHTQ